MKLAELLNVMFDETWMRITKSDGKQVDVWVADYIGGYSNTMEMLKPLLFCEIEDGVDLAITTDPENPRGFVPVLCVSLLGEHELKRISKGDIFSAVWKDNNFSGRQKVTDFYWDNEELVFCTNKKNHETEHYTVEEFVRQMSYIFEGVAGANEIDVSGDMFIFKKGE